MLSSIEDMINTFNEMGIIKKIIVGCCAVYLVLMIITILGHAILGIPIDSYTEETTTKYTDFVQLDTNGDGGLSFDEVKDYDHSSEFSISQSNLQSIFDRCDKNGNGLLIGGEYDHYVYSVKDYLNHLKKPATFLLSSVYERFCDIPWKRPKRPLLYSVWLPI